MNPPLKIRGGMENIFLEVGWLAVELTFQDGKSK